MVDKLYFQRQQGSYCRLHAINNLAQRDLCTTKDFDKLCDEWDDKNRFTDKCSSVQTGCEFYNNGDASNVFGYVMTRKGMMVEMVTYNSEYKSKDKPKHLMVGSTFNAISPINEDLVGILCFNKTHTWCVLYKDEKFYLIDSMDPKPREVPITYFNNQQLKYTVVHRYLPLPDER